MGYMHIKCLYKAKEILLFKECYALEKVHGTSAHIHWDENEKHITFFPGGVKQAVFEACFNTTDLAARLSQFNYLTIYGEAYGGKCQAMQHTYGPDLRFIVFDVKICDRWYDVPEAERIATTLGLEFVPYHRVSTDIDVLNAERDRPSEVAVRRGMGTDWPREGVVLRPLVEVTLADGSRIIAKHKGDAFSELTRTPKTAHGAKLEVLKAREAAEQWVTPMRLQHVADGLQAIVGVRKLSISDTGSIVKAMLEDVYREGAGEVVDDSDTRKAISCRAAQLWKQGQAALVRR